MQAISTSSISGIAGDLRRVDEIPAFAGMTVGEECVIPADAGISAVHPGSRQARSAISTGSISDLDKLDR